MRDLPERESMSDRPIYRLSTAVLKLFLLCWHRLRVRGAENIPDRGGVLIAPNHVSFLDPPVVGASYRARPVSFMARDSLWNSKLGTWWMNQAGCIPVARGTGDIKALKLTIRALKQGRAVSMFPEGTRSASGELQEARGGIGFIIEKSGCVVVPAYIDGTYRAQPKGSRWIRPARITIRYGMPITQKEFQALGTGRSAYDQHAALVMQRIADLKMQH